MALPSLITWVQGSLGTAAELNANVRDGGNFILFPPICQVTLNSALAVAASTWTVVPWQAALVDTDNMTQVFGGSNPSRITASTSGRFEVVACGRFAATATTDSTARGIMIRKNAAGSATGGTLISDSGTWSSTASTIGSAITIETTCLLTAWTFLNAGDYLEMFAYQTTSGSLNLLQYGAANSGTEMETALSAQFINTA